MATGSLYIGFVMQVGFGVVQFLGEVLPKFLRKFWWNFPKAGPIAGAVLSAEHHLFDEKVSWLAFLFVFNIVADLYL